MGLSNKAKADEDNVVARKLNRRQKRAARGAVAHKSADRCPKSGIMRPDCPYKVRKSDATCQCD